MNERSRKHALRVATISTLVTFSGMLLLPSVAPAAPVDSASADCRAAIGKSASKLAHTAMKAFDGCIKVSLKNQAGNCSTLLAADLKNKVPTATGKLQTAIATECNDVSAAVALAEHLRCGPPIGTAIVGFADVSTCNPSLITVNVEATRGAILDPNYAAASDDAAKCANAIAKNATKLLKTTLKVKDKAVKSSDSAGGDSDYNDPGDPQSKIAAARAKAESGIASACGVLPPGDWASVGTCAATASGAADCALDAIEALSAGLAASSYDQPGSCPGSLEVTLRQGGGGGARLSATDWDWGGSGIAHSTDLTTATLALDVGCGAPTDNSCALCTLDPSCAAGNCRCANDSSLLCDEPFGPDADDCAGNDCRMLLGPPVPYVIKGLNWCTVNEVSQGGSGLMSFVNGAIGLSNLEMSSRVHVGDFINSCPECVGGVCDGGARAGLGCTVDAQSDAGEVSYDCLPSLVTNVTGVGIQQALDLANATSVLPFALPCDGFLGAFDCACSTCSLDNSITCNSDADCSGVGAGICRLDGAHGGAPREPNSCDDLTCEDVGNEHGECAGQVDFYCDSVTQGDGDGMLPCFTNADCDSYGDCGTPGPDACGTCTVSEQRKCFLDPVVATGETALTSGALASTYCVESSSNGGINSALGFPGPARLTMVYDSLARCSDGVTPWGPGGGNCP